MGWCRHLQQQCDRRWKYAKRNRQRARKQPTDIVRRACGVRTRPGPGGSGAKHRREVSLPPRRAPARPPRRQTSTTIFPNAEAIWLIMIACRERCCPFMVPLNIHRGHDAAVQMGRIPCRCPHQDIPASNQSAGQRRHHKSGQTMTCRRSIHTSHTPE